MRAIFTSPGWKSLLYLLWAATLQVCGSYYLWSTIRGDRSVPIGVLGCIMLIAGALVMGLQQVEFGRAYLGYAGVLTIAALGWVSMQRRATPDLIDFAGAALILGGIAIILFTPRN